MPQTADPYAGRLRTSLAVSEVLSQCTNAELAALLEDTVWPHLPALTEAWDVLAEAVVRLAGVRRDAAC